MNLNFPTFDFFVRWEEKKAQSDAKSYVHLFIQLMQKQHQDIMSGPSFITSYAFESPPILSPPHRII